MPTDSDQAEIESNHTSLQTHTIPKTVDAHVAYRHVTTASHISPSATSSQPATPAAHSHSTSHTNTTSALSAPLHLSPALLTENSKSQSQHQTRTSPATGMTEWTVRIRDAANRVLDILPGDCEEPFTLENMSRLIEAHRAVGKSLLVARVETADPKLPGKPIYFYYAAHHLNKVIFRKLGAGNEYLFRLFALNPLTNTEIVGDVYYFLVQPLPSPASKTPKTPEIRRMAAGNNRGDGSGSTTATGQRGSTTSLRRGSAVADTRSSGTGAFATGIPGAATEQAGNASGNARWESLSALMKGSVGAAASDVRVAEMAGPGLRSSVTAMSTATAAMGSDTAGGADANSHGQQKQQQQQHRMSLPAPNAAITSAAASATTTTTATTTVVSRRRSLAPLAIPSSSASATGMASASVLMTMSARTRSPSKLAVTSLGHLVETGSLNALAMTTAMAPARRGSHVVKEEEERDHTYSDPKPEPEREDRVRVKVPECDLGSVELLTAQLAAVADDLGRFKRRASGSAYPEGQQIQHPLASGSRSLLSAVSPVSPAGWPMDGKVTLRRKSAVPEPAAATAVGDFVVANTPTGLTLTAGSGTLLAKDIAEIGAPPSSSASQHTTAIITATTNSTTPAIPSGQLQAFADASFIGTDDDFLQSADVRDLFAVNALEPADVVLFDIPPEALASEGIVIPDEILEATLHPATAFVSESSGEANERLRVAASDPLLGRRDENLLSAEQEQETSSTAAPRQHPPNSERDVLPSQQQAQLPLPPVPLSMSPSQLPPQPNAPASPLARSSSQQGLLHQQQPQPMQIIQPNPNSNHMPNQSGQLNPHATSSLSATQQQQQPQLQLQLQQQWVSTPLMRFIYRAYRIRYGIIIGGCLLAMSLAIVIMMETAPDTLRIMAIASGITAAGIVIAVSVFVMERRGKVRVPVDGYHVNANTVASAAATP